MTSLSSSLSSAANKYLRHQCAWLEIYIFFQFFVFDQSSWHGLLMKLYRQNYGRNLTIIVQLGRKTPCESVAREM